MEQNPRNLWLEERNPAKLWLGGTRAAVNHAYHTRDREGKRRLVEEWMLKNGESGPVASVEVQGNLGALGFTSSHVIFAASPTTVFTRLAIDSGISLDDGNTLALKTGGHVYLEAHAKSDADYGRMTQFFNNETVWQLNQLVSTGQLPKEEAVRLAHVVNAEAVLALGLSRRAVVQSDNEAVKLARRASIMLLAGAANSDGLLNKWTRRILLRLLEDEAVHFRGLDPSMAATGVGALITQVASGDRFAPSIRAALARLSAESRQDAVVEYHRLLAQLQSPHDIGARTKLIDWLLPDAGNLDSPGNPVRQASISGPVQGASQGANYQAATSSRSFSELDEMIGLEPVKEAVRDLVALGKVQERRLRLGLPTASVTNHLVFVGNPGTGKTTVARLLGACYREIGILERGQLVEARRADLVAGYSGQTAPKVRALFEKARGGVLFVDEAYGLIHDERDIFGREATEELMTLVENHRDDTAVILAGYQAEVDEFLATNPGLSSRFTRQIAFPDYTNDELVEIFIALARTRGYTLVHDGVTRVTQAFAVIPRENHFGNGRAARTLFEDSLLLQARRLARAREVADEELSLLTADDIPMRMVKGGSHE